MFIAINFKENTKSSIQDIIRKVKGYAVQGRFVQNEHMHLTLEFLGEIPPSEVDTIKDIIDQVATHPFAIQLSGIGFFKRRGGDICWLGIEYNKPLYVLQSRLHDKLSLNGFKLENRPYEPHITIGRKVRMDNSFSPEMLLGDRSNIIIDIDKIELMKSQHINGKLVYTVIYTRTLK